LGALVTGKLLHITEYATTLRLVWRRRAFVSLVLLSGVISGAFVAIVLQTRYGQHGYFGLSNFLFWTLAIGVFGPLLRAKVIEMLNVTDQMSPLIRLPFLLFEQHLLDEIRIDEYFLLKILAGEHMPEKNTGEPANNWTDLEAVRAMIRDNVPTRLSEGKRLKFLADLDTCKTIEDAMALYTRLIGPHWFHHVFSQPQPEVERTDIALPISSRRMRSAHGARLPGGPSNPTPP
jgi:hypothetical protein